jgi:hypothetical protein
MYKRLHWIKNKNHWIRNNKTCYVYVQIVREKWDTLHIEFTDVFFNMSLIYNS